MLRIGIFLGILAILIIAIVSIYNKLVKYRNMMQEAWSGIDVFLKKRHDLVPTLVETVKAYAAHEKTTLEDITRYRSDAMQAKNTEAQVTSENRLANALSNLFVVVEKYPDLKANVNFLRLQQQLADLEHDLESSRRYYNGTVRINNIYVESFPSNIIAVLFNFRKGVFFSADSSEKEVPQVSL
jgi:LemA protein